MSAKSVRRYEYPSLASDWPEHCGIEPWLVETLVDVNRHGGCYRGELGAVGETTGRGRLDRHHCCKGEAPKTVFLSPLVDDAAREG